MEENIADFAAWHTDIQACWQLQAANTSVLSAIYIYAYSRPVCAAQSAGLCSTIISSWGQAHARACLIYRRGLLKYGRGQLYFLLSHMHVQDNTIVLFLSDLSNWRTVCSRNQRQEQIRSMDRNVSL